MFSLLSKIISTVMAFLMIMSGGASGNTEKKCEAKFNGTFIQSWMGSKWDDARWEKEIQNMKEAGIEYLIIQDVANKSTAASGGKWKVFYDSDVSDLKNAAFDGNSVEKTLRHCSKAGIKVFVGLAMFDDFWYQGAMTSQYGDMCSVAADMVKDLYNKYYKKYPETFYGWYFTPEINNVLTCQINIDGMADGLNEIIDSINEVNPSMPLLLSPFYAEYLANGPVPTLANLVRFFDRVNFRDGDIFAVQDAVGAKWVSEDNLEMTWELYKKAVDSCDADIRLWANCENFTLAFADTAFDGIFSRPATENSVVVTSTLDRFVWQMNVASRYAENIITFSYNHYYSPDEVNPAFIETYLDYVENGCVLETEAPSAVKNFAVSKSFGKTVLTWDEADDNIGIAYYRIEKDGRFLSRVEIGKEKTELRYVDSGNAGKYTITAFDAAGNSSQPVSAG